MENLKRRGLSLLLALVMIVSLFAGIQLPQASAATVDYVYSGDYVYNWGTRGTTATYLSPKAEIWWSNSGTTYSALSALNGSSNLDTVSTSALYTKLAEIMADAHTYETSYEATKNLYKYTDCQNSGGALSAFYSGKSVGPAWGSSSTWNREHTWPQSKGASGTNKNSGDENDIMMLRPADSSTNSSRGNKAYGESDGYYDPNSVSGGSLNLHGDVARIFLYVYVRWGITDGNGEYDNEGNPYTTWGTNGVIESVDVLLDWMEEDPVDTWELGRNDAVQSITGTRNVFVDYPELAFLLFAEEVPTGYSSPSGGNNTSTSSYAVTLKENGVTVDTLTGNSVELPTATAPEGYTFEGWVEAEVDKAESKPTIYAAGASYLPSKDTTLYALYSYSEDGDSSDTSNTYTLYSGTLTEGDYIIVYDDGAMKNSVTSNRLDYLDVTITDDTISSPDASIVWHIAPDGSYWTIFNEAASSYAASTGAKSKAALATSITDKARWTVTGDSTYEFVNLKNSSNSVNANLRRNDKYGFACYSTSTGKALSLYKAASSSGSTTYYTTTTCPHTNTTSKSAEDATCTADGYTAGVYCNDCNTYISGHEVIKSEGHNYESVVTPPTATEQGYTTHTCTACGDSKVDTYVPALGEDFTVSFVVPNTVTAIAPVTGNNAGVTLPTAESPEGYTFLGWVETKINNATTEPTFYARESNFVATKATTLYALYTYSIGGEGGKTITFELGENGSATHSDGKDLTEAIVFTADDGVTMLSFTGITKAYYNAFDAKGNSALKFGTGSAVGSVTFAVPDNVTEVQLLVAGYKTATVGITVNGNAQTISTTSDNGAYTTVQVDTTGTKSVTFTTTTNKRAMMDAIKFIVPGQDAIYYTTELCLHINTTTVTDKATCTEEGRETITCDDCDAVLSDTILPAIGHNHVSGVCANCGDTKYISFVTPEGVEKISAIIAAGADIELPEANVPTGEHEYTFVGWSKTPIDNTDSYGGTVYTTTDTSFTSNTTLYAVYTYVETIGGEGGSTTTSEILFNLGANGTATHKDGSTDKATYSQTNGEYTLSLTGGSKMYPSSYDAKGNSCIKLGTGSAAGKFSFTVPDDVKSVEIHVAKYKANTSKVTINGTTTTLTKASNNGEYDVITVDTSTTKTVSVTTVSGGYRAMVNTIVFVVESAGGSEPEDVTFHTTVITDACTHTKTTTNTVAPTTTTEGYRTVTCSDCGATVSHTVLSELKFTAASLEVGEGISINFKVPANMFAEGMYDLDSVVATFTYVDHPEDSFTVTQPILKNGNWIFQLKNIRPDWMGDDVTATISATFNGEEVTGTVQTIEYSIAEYCYNKLENETAETSFSTLLVDMLNYGAATQLHTGYKTDALVNADLTDTQKGWGSDTTKTLTNVQGLSGEAGSVSWKGAALFLRETTRIRLRFAAEDVTGLTVVATVGGNSYELTNFISAGNGQYYVFFDNLLATQMRDNVEFTVMDGDAAVSKTLTYSVASYAAAVSESNTTLYNMIHAMMRYGDAVYAYAG